MGDYLEIKGGVPLRGTVPVSGAKNAALPMLIAALLTGESCEFLNVPNIRDVSLTLRLLEHFGAETSFRHNRATVVVPALRATEASYSLVKALRASFWVLAPLLARGGAARVALPGGDIIGARPVDLHLAALAKMGAEITVRHGVVYATAVGGLRPARVDLRFPSVGATHQILMAAACTPGTTVLTGAACEPEVVALACLLNSMGAEIVGAGAPQITISGRKYLNGTKATIIGDRIEAATYLLAGAATGGDVRVDGIAPMFFGRFMEVLDQLGVQVMLGSNWVRVVAPNRLHSVTVQTGPFPEFATDLQALLMAAVTIADGKSTIEENVFEGRFGHVAELCRMGARISVEGRLATVTGVADLSGAPVEAFDIRGAAALMIAALAARGTTQLLEPQHLRRGYSGLESKLCQLGAQVGVKVVDPEDFLAVGC